MVSPGGSEFLTELFLLRNARLMAAGILFALLI